MNPLQRTLIEKAGYDHGFEYVLPAEHHVVNLASARHRAQARITQIDDSWALAVTSPTTDLLNAELARSFPELPRRGHDFVVGHQDDLARLLRRAAALAHALPHQAQQDFAARLAAEQQHSSDTLKHTEVERWVRQRLGQQTLRNAMLAYWGGACAVTGLAMPELLRASHAKPWAECASDFERLDVFNGVLLSANLDALFDRLLISFSDTGELLVSSAVTAESRALLALDRPLRLRWLASEHLIYLRYQREKFFTATNG